MLLDNVKTIKAIFTFNPDNDMAFLQYLSCAREFFDVRYLGTKFSLNYIMFIMFVDL